MTRQVPSAGSVWNSGVLFSSESVGSREAGSRAAKSLSKTKVEVYSGFFSPLARVFPGQR